MGGGGSRECSEARGEGPLWDEAVIAAGWLAATLSVSARNAGPLCSRAVSHRHVRQRINKVSLNAESVLITKERGTIPVNHCDGTCPCCEELGVCGLGSWRWGAGRSPTSSP